MQTAIRHPLTDLVSQQEELSPHQAEAAQGGVTAHLVGGMDPSTGGTDSIWMDLSAPVLTSPDARRGS